jgi:protease-4
MKRFFIRLLASIGFLVVLLIAAGIGAYFWFVPDREEARVPDSTVLVLRLRHSLSEESPSDPFARYALRERPSLRDLVEALERAGMDERVHALVADLGGASLGLAQSQELRQAVERFRGRGKATIAFADSFGEMGTSAGGYYLAAAFEEIWLQPSGDVGLTGISIESVFLRGLLDKLGVTAEIGQRKEFKSAMSALTDRGFTAPVRANLEGVVGSLFDQIVADLARDRRLDPVAVRQAIDRGPHDAAASRRLGLVDRLGYWDEARAEARRRAGQGAQPLPLARYLEHAGRPHRDGTRVALIHGSGPIVRGGGERDPLFGRGTLGADQLVRAFDDAAADPKVAAILFRIDSPGGSYVGSDTVWHAVTRARQQGKPVVVSMSDVAASGGYFMAAPADRIVAQPGTLTGSIGVVTGKLVMRELTDTLGITVDQVRAGAHAGMWSSHRPFSTSERAKLEAGLDRVYDDFTAKVAAGRKQSRVQVEASAKGQVWTGAQARELGLVDALGGYQTALDQVRVLANLAPDAPVALAVYPKEKDSLGLLLDLLLDGEDVRLGGFLGRLGALASLADRLQPLVGRLAALEGMLPQGVLEAPPLAARH